MTSTVGFGDITAETGAARLAVTGKMIIDLVAVGLSVKVIMGAVKKAVSACRQATDLPIRRPVTGPAGSASRGGLTGRGTSKRLVRRGVS